MGWRQTRLIRSRRSCPPSGRRECAGVTDTLRLHNHRTDKEIIKKDGPRRLSREGLDAPKDLWVVTGAVVSR